MGLGLGTSGAVEGVVILQSSYVSWVVSSASNRKVTVLRHSSHSTSSTWSCNGVSLPLAVDLVTELASWVVNALQQPPPILLSSHSALRCTWYRSGEEAVWASRTAVT